MTAERLEPTRAELNGRLGFWVDAEDGLIVDVLVQGGQERRFSAGLWTPPVADRIRDVARDTHSRNAFPQSETDTPVLTVPAGEWVSTTQAAKLLKVTERTVRNRIARKAIRAKRIGGRWLVSLDDIRSAK